MTHKSKEQGAWLRLQLRWWKPSYHRCDCGCDRRAFCGSFGLIHETRPHRTMGWQFWLGDHMFMLKREGSA